MKDSTRFWRLAMGIAAPIALTASVIGAQIVRFNEVGVHPHAAAQPTDWGRELTALAAFNGKIYAGYGDWNANTGPIYLCPFDPATDTFGRCKLSAPTEAVFRFRKIDGKLYAPDFDPLGSTPGGYAVGTATGADESWIHTAPVPATHIFDMASYGGELWMCGSYGHNATVWRGSSAGAWETSLSVPGNGARCWGLGVFRSRLYAVVAHESTIKSRVFDGTRWSDGPVLLPNGGRGLIRSRAFANRLVYLGANSSLTTFTGTGGVDLNMRVLDYKIYDNRMYTLEDGGVIKSTSDLVHWETIDAAPAGSLSLAILDYHLYVGTRDSRIYRYTVPVASPPGSPTLLMNAAIGGGLWELAFKGMPDTRYEFRSSPTLDFGPDTLIQNLLPGDPAEGSIGGTNDSVLTTDSHGEGRVRVALAGPSNFVVAKEASPLAATAEKNRITLPAAAVLHAVGTPEPGLIYTWTKVSGPGSVSFSHNASTAASTCKATFDRAGTYTLRVANSAGHTSDLELIVDPVPDPIVLPGVLQAEDYASGGEGVGYHDTTPGNSGNVAAYSDDVDIEPCSEGGYNVGWIRTGEWLAYNVQVESTARYRITARVATTHLSDKTFRIELDGSALTGPVTFNTGGAGWQSWRDVDAGRWLLTAGTHQLRILADTSYFNINYLEVRAEVFQPGDGDGDGLADEVETNTGVFVSATDTGTDPGNPDSDGDGAGDWYEVAASYTDPTDAGDQPFVPYPLPPYNGSPGLTYRPVKVYIMAGDNAMVGTGRVHGTEPGTLHTMVNQEKKFPDLADAKGNWVTRNDVYVHSFGTNNTNMNFSKLSPTRAGNYFGPELGFGHVMGWYHDEPVLLIKAANGNRALGWDLLPPGSPRFDWNNGLTYPGYGESPETWITGNGPTPYGWYGGKEFDDYFLDETDMGPRAWEAGTSYPVKCQVRHNGMAYRCQASHTASAESEPGIGENWPTYWSFHSVNNTVDFLDHFAVEYPQWGYQGFEIAGYVWWQGRRDANTAAHAAKYEENLVRLINQIRQYYADRYPRQASPDAPFVVATLANYGWSQSGAYEQIASAQLAVDGATGTHPEFAGNVRTVEARGYWRDGSESPITKPAHYNHNAETFMLAGDAMARAMIELQNRPPLLAADNWVVTADEGSEATNTGFFFDNAHDTVTISADIGTVTQTGTDDGTWSWSYTPVDGPLTPRVTITATDSFMAERTTSFALEVDNVAPAVVLDSVTPIDENGTVTLTGTITDPGTLDTFTLEIDWGDPLSPDNNGSAMFPPSATGSQPFTLSHRYLDDNPSGTARDRYTIEATLTDNDGGIGNDSESFMISNVRPQLDLDPVAAIDENGIAILGGTITDPGTLDSFILFIDWGDPLCPNNFEHVDLGPSATGSQGFTLSHRYPDDHPSATPADDKVIFALLLDDEGASDSALANALISNVAPKITHLDVVPGADAVSIDVGFSDPGVTDTHRVEILWGDGAKTQLKLPVGDRGFEASHRYAGEPPPAGYPVSVTVSDDDEGSDTRTSGSTQPQG